jgi:hypothetical protein
MDMKDLLTLELTPGVDYILAYDTKAVYPENIENLLEAFYNLPANSENGQTLLLLPVTVPPDRSIQDCVALLSVKSNQS